MSVMRCLESTRWPGSILVALTAGMTCCSTCCSTWAADAAQAEAAASDQIRVYAEPVPPLTEPPCSYCSTEHRKGFVRLDDRVVAWLRGAHNGGAAPLRHFLAGPRVINDTYGLFFYDPDGGYVAVYQKDYGYRLHGWRKGVMVVQGPDGSLWSALSGRCLAGPREGSRLTRVPSLQTSWGYWLMLHPESTAYNLFDGERYQPVPLPTAIRDEVKADVEAADPRLPATATVLGISIGDETKAYPVDPDLARAVYRDTIADRPVAVFWYQPTRTAVAFSAKVDGRRLTFEADEISPESAPVKDRETGSRWTLAGRAVDGPLRGTELEWIDSIQCRWYAWSAEYPETDVFVAPQ